MADDLPAGDAVAVALDASNLAELDDPARSEVLAQAIRRTMSAGSTFHRQGEHRPHCEVIVAGLARVYVTAPDGRTMTIRYCRPGSMLGAASLFHRSFTLPASIQAVTDVQLLDLRPEAVARATRRRPAVAMCMLAELSERAMSFLAEIPSGAFTTVPERVARHLLDLATGTQRGRTLIARVGHQELADAVGTVREMVVRALADFRRRGLVRTGRRKVVILDPEGLLDLSYGDEMRQDCDSSR